LCLSKTYGRVYKTRPAYPSAGVKDLSFPMPLGEAFIILYEE